MVPNVGSSLRISYWIGVVALSVDGFQVKVTSLPATDVWTLVGVDGACVSRAQNFVNPP